MSGERKSIKRMFSEQQERIAWRTLTGNIQSERELPGDLQKKK